MTITVAVPPAGILTANQRLHWARKARTTATLRQRAVMAWRLAGSPQHDAAHVVAHIDYPDMRARDVHNLMPTCKALIDGMVHPGPGLRGLLPDDSDAYLTGPDLRHQGVTRGAYTFRFEVQS